MEPIILNKKFSGPFLKLDQLESKRGVYVVICEAFGMTPFRVLNAGYSEDVKASLSTKKKKNFLKKSKVKDLKFLISYEDNENLSFNLLNEIKKQFNPTI